MPRVYMCCMHVYGCACMYMHVHTCICMRVYAHATRIHVLHARVDVRSSFEPLAAPAQSCAKPSNRRTRRYVIREFEDAIDDCNVGSLNNNDGSVNSSSRLRSHAEAGSGLPAFLAFPHPSVPCRCTRGTRASRSTLVRRRARASPPESPTAA